jgi:hypothetical protein
MEYHCRIVAGMPGEQKRLIHASQFAAHETLSAPESPLSLCYVTDRERRGEWECACAQNLKSCCVEINQLNAMNYILLYFLLRWLLHVSAKQCHPQGATMFLRDIARRYVGSVICPVTCLLPYWCWSGSESNIVAPWGWHCFAETCRNHRKRKIKKCII